MSVVRDINTCERRKVHGSGMRVVSLTEKASDGT